jgi:hypothetical protein
MSQQAAAVQGAGHGSGRKHQYFAQGGGIDMVKLHKLAISEIANNTFNTVHNKFVAQFMEMQKNVANYLMVIGGRGLPGSGDGANGEEADDRAPRGHGREGAGQGQSEYHQEQGDKFHGKKATKAWRIVEEGLCNGV